MSTIAILEIQRALYAKLSGDAVLMGLVTGVYDLVPQNSVYPYLVFSEGMQRHHAADGITLYECVFELSAVTEAGGRKAALMILNRVQGLLHMGTLSVNGCSLLTVRVDQASTRLVEEASVLVGTMRVVLDVMEA